MMENKPASLKLMMTLGLVAMGQRAFMNRTVGEILWGYEDPFVSFLNKYFPDMFPMKDKFGLFVGVSVLCPCRESGCLLRTLTQTSLYNIGKLSASITGDGQDDTGAQLDPVQVGDVTGV